MLMGIVVFLVALTLIVMGVFTLGITAVASIGTGLLYEWDKQATQGTIILTTIGISLVTVGKVML